MLDGRTGARSDPDRRPPRHVPERCGNEDDLRRRLRRVASLREVDRQLKPSTIAEYRSVVARHLEPAFGTLPLAQVTTDRIKAWRAGVLADGRLSRRTVQKVLTNLHTIFERARKVYGLPVNPCADVERPTPTYNADLEASGGRTDIDANAKRQLESVHDFNRVSPEGATSRPARLEQTDRLGAP